MNTRRPLTLILALVLFALVTAFGLITPLGPRIGANQPPLVIVLYAFIVMGVGGLIALVGLWTLKRWGLLLTSVIAALSILMAVPGLWIAPTTGGKVISLVLSVVNALALVLLVVLPATRKAVAAARAPVTA
jgi:hypothetical protein